MNKTMNTVPYLSDENAQFRMDFVFFDTALSTSEIKPLHLSLPGKQNLKKTMNRTQSSSRGNVELNKTQQRANQNHSPRPSEIDRQQEPVFVNQVQPNNQSPESSPQPNQMNTFKMKRTLQNTLMQRTHNLRQQSNLESTQDSPEKGQSPQQSQEPRQQSPPVSPKQQDAPQKAPMPRKTPIPEPSQPRQTQMAELGVDFSLTGFYLLPCLPSQFITMSFIIEEPAPNVQRYILKMPPDIDSVARLRCDVNGKSRTSKIDIYYNDQPVGEFKFNSGNKSFSVGLSAMTPALEACAILFNPSFSSSSAPRIFDFVVPALKKVDGRNQMFRVPYQEPSTIIQYVSKMAKEAIRLKTRIPANEGNGFDSTFNGKFLLNAPTNFILYHESNAKRDICTFSMQSENNYSLAVGYPLSPLQAFFAAVASSVPF